MKKLFKFDVIVDENDLCDRESEMKRMLSLIKRRGRIVVYSPRRMGKTSLISVCSKKAKKVNPKLFYLYVDLNEVASIAEAATRFRSHYEIALKDQFPVQRVKTYINELVSRMKINLPGGMEVSLNKYTSTKPHEYLLHLFGQLREMSEKDGILVVLDEFQGIAELGDVQALLRRELQGLTHAAVVLMGSNQRLLYKMFNDKNCPFFGFGEDMELKPIPLEDYLPYMNERFGESNLAISSDIAEYMMEKMNYIPNYINELGSWIVDTMSGLHLTRGHIDEAMMAAARSKTGRYESALFGYTANQKKFITAIAKLGRVKAYTGREMCEVTGLSPTELSRVNDSMEDAPLFSWDTQNRLFIIDPFFRIFLELMS